MKIVAAILVAVARFIPGRPARWARRVREERRAVDSYLNLKGKGKEKKSLRELGW